MPGWCCFLRVTQENPKEHLRTQHGGVSPWHILSQACLFLVACTLISEGQPFESFPAEHAAPANHGMNCRRVTDNPQHRTG